MQANTKTSSERTWALVVSAALLVGLGACSSEEDPETSEATSAAPTAQDRLDTAYDVLSEAGSVHLLMEGTNLPEEASAYVIKAEGSGTTEPPAFDGTITGKISGVQADVPAIAVDGELYLKLPFTPAFASVNPETFGVPDPAVLFSADAGLPSLLQDTDSAEFGGQSRVGRDVVQEVNGTISGDQVADLLTIGDRDAEFDVAYGLIEDSWELRTVTVTGPFYPPVESTYTVTLDEYGVPVTVTAP
ncbi:LppX_LprAFG lipoprotein [Ornithinimicrobium sp. Arc0846-15]|nr:LppX_LprAFG lipoprotein [Ornithinimicrobium laminariae]